MPWKNRYIGNPILSAIGNVFFRCPANDFHCGLRGFSREAFLRMDLRTTGMEFASEMVIKATLLRMRVTEVPTTLSKDGRSRPPHLRPYRDGWRHLRFMLLFSPKWLFFYPGIWLMCLGAAWSVALMRSPFHIHQVRFGIDTLIYAAFMIITGFQSLLFSVMSRVYTVQEGLYTPSETYNTMFRHINLERGLLTGFLMFASGIGTSLYALMQWRHAGFGALDIEHVARLAIPSGLAITLGAEIILGSFFLSTLGINVRQHSTRAPEEYPAADREAAPALLTASAH